MIELNQQTKDQLFAEFKQLQDVVKAVTTEINDVFPNIQAIADLLDLLDFHRNMIYKLLDQPKLVINTPLTNKWDFLRTLPASSATLKKD